MPVNEFFDQILETAVAEGASDVHLTAGCPVRARVSGKLITLGTRDLRLEDTWSIAVHVLRRAGRLTTSQPADAMREMQDADCSYGAAGIGRFRVNICLQRGSVALVMRTIPRDIPDLETLGIPEIVSEIAMEERGLILVTGMTGSGKTTTLAAMLGLINKKRACKLVTIEDPIEFIHNDVQASVMQREIGSDTESFALAMRAALRQDPDVILVGEMRDRETVETALKAAETGHLVMSTLHTTDAPKTIHRLLSFASAAEETIMRNRLADCLRAVISQRLLPTIDPKKRVAAIEIMRTTLSIKDCLINPEKQSGLYDFIQAGRDQYGMQTFDQHIFDLHEQGLITVEVAKAAATSAADFERSLMYV